MSGPAVEQVGDYRVSRRLEASGRELLVADKDDSTYVLALFDVSDKTREALDSEASRSSKLDAEQLHIAAESFMHDGRQVLAFEAVEGLTLLRLMRLLDAEDEGLPDGAITFIGAALMKALSLAHEAKDDKGRRKALVHGELGPHQVFLSWEGQPKLLGVGMGPLFALVAEHGRTPSWMQPYLAPEVRKGNATTVRSNAYSAALMLWSLYARQPPPEEGEPKPLVGLRPDLPRAIASRIDQTLSDKPYTRTGCSLLAKVLASRVKDGDQQELVDALADLRVMVPTTSPLPSEAMPPSSYDTGAGASSGPVDTSPSPGAQPRSSKPGSSTLRSRKSKPGDSKPRSSKPGDSKPGDSKPGSSKPRSSKPRGSKPGSSKPRGSSPYKKRRRTKMMGVGALGMALPRVPQPEEASLDTPFDQRPTTPRMKAVKSSEEADAAAAEPVASDRMAVSVPLRGKSQPSQPAISVKNDSPPQLRRGTLKSMGQIGEDEPLSKAKEDAPSSPRKGRPTKMMAAEIGSAIAVGGDVDVAIASAESGLAKPPNPDGSITDEVSSLDWDLDPLVSDEDSMPGADQPPDEDDEADAASLAKDDGATPEDDGEDIDIDTEDEDAPGEAAQPADELLAPLSEPSPATPAAEASPDALSLTPEPKPEPVQAADASPSGGSPLKWVGLLAVAALLGVGIWWATRADGTTTAETTTAPQPQPSQASSVPTPAPTASSVSAQPQPTATASATASASASTEALDDVDPSSLPPNQGYLVVDAPYHPDTEVYVNGTHVGKAGKPLVVSCGKPLFVRLGTVPQTRWYGPGKAVAAECQKLTKMLINTAPQDTSKPDSDGDIYQ